MARPSKSAAVSSGKIGKDEKDTRQTVETTVRGEAVRPEPPEGLTKDQKAIFKFIVDGLASGDILGKLDVFVLESTAVAIDRLRTINRMIDDDPMLLLHTATQNSRAKYQADFTVTVDHDKSHIYASTDDGTVTLKEDAIGLHADVLIKDKDLIELAKKGKIRGWSFGMYNVKDTMEDRADDLPIRHITGLDLDHLTLVVKKCPIYSATSVELRAEGDVEIETRSSLDTPTITDAEPKKPAFDNSGFRSRIAALK